MTVARSSSSSSSNNNNAIKSSSDDVVIKAPNDKRLYRVIHLRNGLCAVLIHDPEIFSNKEDFVNDSRNKNLENVDDDDDDDDDDDMEEEEDDDDDDDMEEDDSEEEDDEEDEEEEMRERKSSGPPPTKKAAAALCVGMGSFSDPFEAQGLAHFLEHMLFMGSTEFPDENEYDSYLSKHGGSSNAYTETEYTCYHFEVNREFLKGALERFSHFFISPLVKAEAMEREVLAVDSEFNQVLQNDACRLQQLQCHTAAPGHSYNRFFWGNKKSLADAMENGINLREQILHLYKENYHGGLMKLVVIGGGSLVRRFVLILIIGKGNELDGVVFHGRQQDQSQFLSHFCHPELLRFIMLDVYYLKFLLALSIGFPLIVAESLDMLKDWVVELFSDVKEGQQLNPEAQINVPIWKAGKLYRLEAVKEVHSLNLTWTLPCLKKEYLKKPEDYLAHLLGHEGKGSLHFFLKAKGWITSLSAGVGDDGMNRSSVAYIFSMTIHLTDAGLEKINWFGFWKKEEGRRKKENERIGEAWEYVKLARRVYDVVGIIYQYIKLLRQISPQKWIFKELQDIGNMEFKFVEEQPQDDYAAELAANLLLYTEEHIIYGDYVYNIWDDKLIAHVLSFLTPENMRIDILSKSFDKQSKDVQYEPWFGSQFTEEDIPNSLMKLWSDPPEINTSLHLPSKNEFIPRDFSIRSSNSSQNHASVHLPKCLIDQPLIKLWHKLDETFKVPRANTYSLITVKGGYSDLKSCVLTELFLNLLKDELNEILYQAGVAKLDTALSIIGDKLELKLYGFNDKLSRLLSKILNIAKSFTPSGDRFKVIKEEMERTFRNTNMKPLHHSSYLRLQVLRKDFWDVDDKLHCLTDLSLDDLKAFIPKLLSQLHIESLCHGNISKEEAVGISEIFKCNFSIEPLPADLRHEECVICLPSGANLVRDVCVKNRLEVNSVVELYYQIEQDIGLEITKLRALADLFDDIVQEPLFDQLRTKEQLGYVVQCSPRITYRVLGFCICVQSSKYDPVYLLGRIDNFINGVEGLLDVLDDESFEKYKNGLIAKKLEKDPSLSYETDHLWGQIVDKRYMFDMSEKEAEELKSICKNDVIDWYNKYLKPTSPKRRRLAVRVWGCDSNMEEGSPLEPSTVIEDLTILKKSAEFYSSLC
ncbi:hypothetical protein IFM89_033511 [Coptis chinensis]|uniref:Nardilysin-like n=1 Tax=Coptis chinensis TaxID=261450 RepID=A0A835H778_9MAGN|nr:hypothetical protein IFM89_033511 [Coptis chinensis]